MPKFKPPKDEKMNPCPRCGGAKANPAPFMNLDGEHKKWYHPNTMGKMRNQPQMDLREEKKPAQKYKKK